MFASSCSLYDGLPPGMHDEDAPIEPRAAYATSKRYAEEALLRLADEGLTPVILRNGTVYGWSPRMRFDLVVNTFVKDALVTGRLLLHNGGWMWRPLVDIRDVSDAMIAAYEAPAEKVRGEIFNVLHSNYQIRELAMLVAGTVRLAGRDVDLIEAPAPKLQRDYECSNAKLSTTPWVHTQAVCARGGDRSRGASRGRGQGVPHRPAPLQHPLARADGRVEVEPRAVRVRPVRALITGGGGQLAADLLSLLGDDAVSRTHAELDITDSAALDSAFDEIRPDVVFNCAAFHNVDECERDPDPAWAANVRAVRDLASRGAKLVHLSTNYVFDGRSPEPYAEDDVTSPRSIYALTKLAGEHAALAYGADALVARTAGLYGLAGSASKGGNFVQRMISRARETGSLKMVADQRLQPTYTRDLAEALIDAVERDASGVVHLTAGGACSWFDFTVAIMETAGIEAPIEPVETTIGPGGIDRPLNGVLARPRADALGLPELRPWREALEDYMATAGLSAATA